MRMMTEPHKKIENSRNGICSNGICNCIFDYCGSQVIWVTECEFADCNTDVRIGSGKESQLIMKMAEPVMLNPNNYSNVENILINMAESTDIAKSRQWVFLGCYRWHYCLAGRIGNNNPTKFSFLHHLFWDFITGNLGNAMIYGIS